MLGLERFRFFTSSETSRAQHSQAKLALSDIESVIKKVEKNQLSAGQGWREVKRIMQAIRDDDAVQETF